MAIITEANQATIKPDLFDVLMGGDESWDPSETPLFTRGRKGTDSPDAALFRFPYDIPDNPRNTGDVEGRRYAQGSTKTYGGRAALYGRMHHFNETFGVGEVAQGNQVLSTNGEDEFLYQMRRSLREQIKSLEYVAVSNQESQAGNGSTTFVTRGLELWVTPTSLIAAQTDTQTIVPANFRPAEGQVQKLTILGWTTTITTLTSTSVNFVVASTAAMTVGDYVSGTGIAANTQIATITSATAGTLTIAASGTESSGTMTGIYGPNATNPTPNGGTTYSLNESQLNAVFNSVWNVLKAKMKYRLWCTTALKNQVSSWGNLVTVPSGQYSLRRFDQETTEIEASIDKWSGDAGQAEFELHPWLRNLSDNTSTQVAEAIGVDDRFWEWRVRKQPSSKRLPDQAGGMEGYTESTMGVQCVPKYMCKFYRSNF